MGGLIKIDIWDVFVAANPRPTPSTPPKLQHAYAAMKDLQQNVVCFQRKNAQVFS